ncbi:ATP-binding protein [Actinoplanes sp. NPDC051633]|uniref:AAA family ATPase n=1 Tax=Actinoplanes sp. NPDC051633 TaxID=3155670 RepID=UPI003441E244
MVHLLVGLTGAGKTTYSARVLEPAGAVRLSVDELIYERHGQYAVDYPAAEYFSLYEPAVQEIRERMVRELALGHDVALDLGIWSRADRDEWKHLIEKAGGQWRLLYFPVSRAELLARLAERNRLGRAEAMPLRESDLDDFYARFDEPEDEGEEVIQPGSY